MDFGKALVALKEGKKAYRLGWNGRGMHVYLERRLKQADALPLEPCLVMLTASGTLQPGWLASQADMLAEDWGVA